MHRKTNFLNKLLFGDLHYVQVSSIAVSVEGEVVAGQLLQDEQK